MQSSILRSDTARKGREHEEESKNLLVVFGAEFARCCGVLLRSVSLCGVLCGDRQHRFRAILGLQNFIDVLQNELFRTAAKNTLIFMALTVPLGMALALLTALCLRKISRGRQLLSLCLLLPLVVPSGTGAYFWKILFDQNGLLIRTLVLFGVPHESLIQLNGRMAILVFVFLWKTVSYNTILFWSGLNWIPKTYYEQMALEGGGHLAQFRQVTWIYLAPTTFVVFLMSVVNAFKVFKEIYMLFGAYPGPDIYMLQHYMNNLFAALNLPRLSSIAYILFVCIGAVLLVVFRLQKRVSDALE